MKLHTGFTWVVEYEERKTKHRQKSWYLKLSNERHVPHLGQPILLGTNKNQLLTLLDIIVIRNE